MNSKSSHRAIRSVILGLAVFAGVAAALPAQHPALTPPSGFTVSNQSDRERTFLRKLGNGDLLRIRTVLQAAGADPAAIAKGPALGEGDTVRDETKQDVQNGKLRGVAFSCLGKSESIEGLAYTRYRRVMGFTIEGTAEPFAVQADLLCKEPRPAQSTIEAMLLALQGWQATLGGDSTGEPPPDPESKNPASKPVVGGDRLVTLTGGGDLEIRIPNFWGRADLKFGDGHEEIILGPAKDVLTSVTAESIAKDKDRIGPSVTITRMQRDTFKDLVDVQILDIAESLLADYVARMSEAGRTLTMGQREDGSLGTRTVISVPFEEKRASGTSYKGRSIFMMHRGSLVVVTASHPVEKFDEGWPDIAKAFDTLVFTGAPEADPAPKGDSRPAASTPETPPAQQPPATPTGGSQGQPAGDRTATPVQPGTPVESAVAGATLRAPPAPVDWLRETAGPLRTVMLPLPTPIRYQMPAAWSLFGELAAAREAMAFIAVPAGATSAGIGQSSLRVDYVSFLEELVSGNSLGRLSALMRMRLDNAGRAQGLAVTIRGEAQPTLSGLAAVALTYAVTTPAGEVLGTYVGTTFDGTAVLLDFRLTTADSQALGAAVTQILNSIQISFGADISRRSVGEHSVEVPTDWNMNDAQNAGGGRDIFVQAPGSGVSVRFQTAAQKRPEVIDTDTLRRVSEGFLVKGLNVLTVKDLGAARRVLIPGARPGLRFQSTTQDVDSLVLSYVVANEIVFALRGAPRGYRGRDLAVAYRIMRSLTVPHQDGRLVPDPLPIGNGTFSQRVVFACEELDALGFDGVLRARTLDYVAFLPDGSAGIMVERNGKLENLRASYRVENGTVTVEGPGVGRKSWQILDDGETLRGDDVLFRARHEEFP